MRQSLAWLHREVIFFGAASVNLATKSEADHQNSAAVTGFDPKRFPCASALEKAQCLALRSL